MSSGTDSITDQARKFADSDFRLAVSLLEAMGGNLDEALSALRLAAKCSSQSFRAFLASHEVLESLDYDVAAATQLVIVTDSFRDVLGLKKPVEEMHGESLKAS